MDWELEATSRLPSAEAATEIQSLVGALVRVQVWANAKFATVTTAQKLITTGNRVFIYPALPLEHPARPLASKFFHETEPSSHCPADFAKENEDNDG